MSTPELFILQTVPLLIKQKKKKKRYWATVVGVHRKWPSEELRRLWKTNQCCCALLLGCAALHSQGMMPWTWTFDLTTSTVEIHLPLKKKDNKNSAFQHFRYMNLFVFLTAFPRHTRWCLTSVSVFRLFLHYHFNFACHHWNTSWPAGRVSSFFSIYSTQSFSLFWLLRAVPLAFFFVCVISCDISLQNCFCFNFTNTG